MVRSLLGPCHQLPHRYRHVRSFRRHIKGGKLGIVVPGSQNFGGKDLPGFLDSLDFSRHFSPMGPEKAALFGIKRFE